ncbi:hypothetical protein TNCV_2113061 [Trichonephila clavipes]|nr:hypothetical protein TNCV_2113061 [Trichonephila clavipes]
MPIPLGYRGHGLGVTSSSLVQLKTHCEERGGRCTLNLSRLGGVVWKLVEGEQLVCHPRHLALVQNYEIHRQNPSSSRKVLR